MESSTKFSIYLALFIASLSVFGFVVFWRESKEERALAAAKDVPTSFIFYDYDDKPNEFLMQSCKIMPDGKHLNLGSIYFERVTCEIVEIKSFEMGKPFRRKGFGKELFHFVINYLYDQGYRTIFWNAQPIFPSTRSLSSLVQVYTYFCNTLERKSKLSTQWQEDGSVHMKLTLL